MSNLLIGLLGTLLATNQPVAVSNFVFKQTGTAVEIPDLNDPVEREFHKVMEDDDAAQQEVDKWIRDNQAFAREGAGMPDEELNQRILKRFEPIRKEYEDFIAQHPDHARARIAFASFLNDIGDEEGWFKQLEKARELDPSNPAVWNNLGNYYGHYGEPKKAFEYYDKAISLNTNEPVYYQNQGTMVYLFRVDSKEYYNLTEQQVFDKAMDLYDHALKLDPDSFELATFVAQTYYGIKPLRTNDALLAWTNALKIAHNEVEREGAYIHLARTKMMAGMFDEAKAQLNLVTNENFLTLRGRITRAIERKIADPFGTNDVTDVIEGE